MTAYVALLRAVNVSGTGKLPMRSLRQMGEECGFERVRTFIASGNLLFASELDEAAVRAAIAAKIGEFFGKPVPVFVRAADELDDVVNGNPFADDKPNRVMAYFIDDAPSQHLIDEARDIAGERLALGRRAVYVSYGDGIGSTKLKIPTIRKGTARNMNSVAKMAELLKALA